MHVALRLFLCRIIMSGALGVFESARFIASQATRVKIRQEGIAMAAKLVGVTTG